MFLYRENGGGLCHIAPLLDGGITGILCHRLSQHCRMPCRAEHSVYQHKHLKRNEKVVGRVIGTFEGTEDALLGFTGRNPGFRATGHFRPEPATSGHFRPRMWACWRESFRAHQRPTGAGEYEFPPWLRLGLLLETLRELLELSQKELLILLGQVG